jgi:hypothetical protein
LILQPKKQCSRKNDYNTVSYLVELFIEKEQRLENVNRSYVKIRIQPNIAFVDVGRVVVTVV